MKTTLTMEAQTALSFLALIGPKGSISSPVGNFAFEITKAQHGHCVMTIERDEKKDWQLAALRQIAAPLRPIQSCACTTGKSASLGMLIPSGWRKESHDLPDLKQPFFTDPVREVDSFLNRMSDFLKGVIARERDRGSQALGYGGDMDLLVVPSASGMWDALIRAASNAGMRVHVIPGPDEGRSAAQKKLDEFLARKMRLDTAKGFIEMVKAALSGDQPAQQALHQAMVETWPGLSAKTSTEGEG